MKRPSVIVGFAVGEVDIHHKKKVGWGIELRLLELYTAIFD